jgi:hypothetical protein
MALFARVIALTMTQIGEALRAQGLLALRGAAGLLDEGADRAHAEARSAAQRDVAPHRDGPVGAVGEIEPQQDPRAARRVDLAALERGPDVAAAAPIGVHGDEAARVHEARAAFDVDELPKARRAGEDFVRAPGIVRTAFRNPADALRVGFGVGAAGVGHVETSELFVARARPSAVVVARAMTPAKAVGGRPPRSSKFEIAAASGRSAKA